MSCLKILVVCILAQCCGHHIHLQKSLKNPENGGLPNIMASVSKKWKLLDKIEGESVIQKREVGGNGETLPSDPKVLPAPVMEQVQDKEDIEAAPTLYGFVRREPIVNRVSLIRTAAPGLNTNIRESISQSGSLNPSDITPGPQTPAEMFEGLPPRPVQPITATGPAETEYVPLLVPPASNPVPQNIEETPPTGLFNRLNVRRYAVYAGDVILKYLSQFFNRARVTFNRFTTPPSPTPMYEN